ncbi:ABC transporter permease subunit [Rhodovulum sulfidophilum]|uniref:ABC transporter permease subunit n=1 Tax=Rhodovulum sulfidophilum TaxID=35806 RepID=UPI0009522957|nr:hypothetical protein [Rhodovulum sulfidophilum]OLS47898.1 hypothetical protein BV379_06105 [Rhodovulum sulfidophilum]
MWFGFDWQFEAVVVAMVFFPVLVNTPQGLTAADPMQCDQMEIRSENYLLTLTGLRLPAATPFIFNGLKIAPTLALMGVLAGLLLGTGGARLPTRSCCDSNG